MGRELRPVPESNIRSKCGRDTLEFWILKRSARCSDVRANANTLRIVAASPHEPPRSPRLIPLPGVLFQ